MKVLTKIDRATESARCALARCGVSQRFDLAYICVASSLDASRLSDETLKFRGPSALQTPSPTSIDEARPNAALLRCHEFVRASPYANHRTHSRDAANRDAMASIRIRRSAWNSCV
jgi:hypothetical protein